MLLGGWQLVGEIGAADERVKEGLGILGSGWPRMQLLDVRLTRAAPAGLHAAPSFLKSHFVPKKCLDENSSQNTTTNTKVQHATGGSKAFQVMSEWRYSVMLAASAVALTLTMAAWRRRRIAERFAPPKRFAFVNTEPAVKWADHPEIFFKALGMPRHMWDEYHCYNGEFPSSSELRSRYSGLIVTGSHFSVYEPHEWIPRLLQVLRECASLPHLRVIGCCFGCQSVATALGGTVAPNPDGHFVLRNETVSGHHSQTHDSSNVL